MLPDSVQHVIFYLRQKEKIHCMLKATEHSIYNPIKGES